MLRFVQLSDPHFGTIRVEVLEALKRELQEVDPDLILLTGDITQRARLDEFYGAREFVRSFHPKKVLVTPGNHDIPLFNLVTRFFSPYSHYRTAFPGPLEQVENRDDVAFVMLNSTRRTRHVQGSIDVQELRSRLRALPAPTKMRIVGFHHPLDCRQEVDDKNLLCNRSEVVQVLAESQVDLVLGGHIHDPFYSLSQDRYSHIQRGFVIGVAGTCLSSRTRLNASNSFNLIELNPDADGGAHLAIVRYDYRVDLDAAAGHRNAPTPEEIHQFHAVETHRFRRDPLTRSWSRGETTMS